MGNGSSTTVRRTAAERTERQHVVRDATTAAAAQLRQQRAALPPPAQPASNALIPFQSLCLPPPLPSAGALLDVAARQLERNEKDLTKADLIAILARLLGIRDDDSVTLLQLSTLSAGELRARIRLTVFAEPAHVSGVAVAGSSPGVALSTSSATAPHVTPSAPPALLPVNKPVFDDNPV